jgi:Trk K+ transport system NAD-binding subunit
VVTKRAVIDAYNLRTFQEDLSGGMGSAVNAVRDGRRMVEVVSGMHVGEVDLPTRFTGKTLRELDLRREFGLEVVLIHREAPDNGGSHGVFPSPDLRLEAGDRIVVMGEKTAIPKLTG